MQKIFILFCVLIIAITCSNNFLGQITHGKFARKGQFPFITKLVFKKSFGLATCGGSLISDRWILTAAHCTMDAYGGIAMMGRNQFDEDNYEMRTFNLSDMIIHRDYEAGPITNDVSVIRLSCPVNFTNLIRPVKLPMKAGNVTYDGHWVTTAGWGAINDTNKTSQPRLSFTKLLITPQNNCTKFYETFPNYKQICVLTTNMQSTCSGDSGGPAILDDNRRTQIGIVSFGSAFGCEQNLPIAFTNVAFYLPWIQNVTGVGVREKGGTQKEQSFVCPKIETDRNLTTVAKEYLDHLGK